MVFPLSTKSVDNFVDKCVSCAGKPCAAWVSTDCPKGKQKTISFKINGLDKYFERPKNLFCPSRCCHAQSVFVNKFVAESSRTRYWQPFLPFSRASRIGDISLDNLMRILTSRSKLRFLRAFLFEIVVDNYVHSYEYWNLSVSSQAGVPLEILIKPLTIAFVIRGLRESRGLMHGKC